METIVSKNGKWLLLLGALLYAAGVSVYVATSSLQAMPQGAAAGSSTALSGFMFLYILAPAAAFMLLVGILDLITRRPQQLLIALSIGLAASATYEAVVQAAFIQSYTYYKTSSVAREGAPSPTASGNR